MFVSPEVLTATSVDLAELSESIRAAYAAAAPSTMVIAGAGNDEVSTAIAKLFGTYAEDFHGIATQASLFHDQVVQTLRGGANQYTVAEASSTTSLQDLSGILSPVETLTGRPLIGNGADQAAG